MRIAALDEEAVRIMAVGQSHGTYVDTLLGQAASKRLSRLLTTAMGIGGEGQIHGSWTVADLAELAGIEVGT